VDTVYKTEKEYGRNKGGLMGLAMISLTGITLGKYMQIMAMYKHTTL
jgi:hypothetical protein